MSCGNQVEGEDGAKEEVLMPRRRGIRLTDKSTCQRCKTAKSKFIIRTTTYCTPCFETHVFSRFSRQLYPPLQTKPLSIKNPAQRNLHRPPRASGNVLVAVSGGAGSLVMLEMLMRGGFIGMGDVIEADITKGEKDVVWEKGTVVYVDYANVVEGLEDRTKWIEDVVKERGLEFVGLKAEDVFDPTLRERLGGSQISTTIANSSSTPLESLQRLLLSLPSPSRPALFSNILHALLNITASSLPNISHLLSGETSTRQAQRVISATAVGRGWALPLELAASMDLPGGITRLSPMKDLSLKEAAFACRVRRIETRNARVWGRVAGGEGRRDARGKGGAMSIEGLTEQFIAGLSVTHPATVSTINRTGDKLVFPGGSYRDNLCPLCQMPVDPSAMTWKSRTALTSLPKTVTSQAISTQSLTDMSTLAPMLCYACLTTLTPATSKSGQLESADLPLWIGERVTMSGERMKSSFAEFLLDGDS